MAPGTALNEGVAAALGLSFRRRVQQPAAPGNADGQTDRKRQSDSDSFAHSPVLPGQLVLAKLFKIGPAAMIAAVDFAIKRIVSRHRRAGLRRLAYQAQWSVLPGLAAARQAMTEGATEAMRTSTWIAAGVVTAALASPVAPARAQPVAEFFRGKTITMLIGYTSGGGYDLYARVLSRHMGRHIPGNPDGAAEHAGRGSLRVAGFLYSAAPKDGTTIGMFGRGVAMEPLIGSSAATFDARKFTWLGSGSDQVSLCATWHTSPVKTWDDMLKHPFTVGGEGPGSDPDMFAIMLKSLLGAKLKLVSGYPGGPEVNLAMERGEVDGRCGWSWTSIKITRSDWLRSKRIHLALQMALQKSPELPDVPLVMDAARNDPASGRSCA